MSEPYNAGERKSIRNAEKLAKITEQQHREAVIAIMTTRNGRAWIERKLSDAHIFYEEFTGNALREAFQKGQRSFGLSLLADIHRFCPEEYLTMMREKNERDSRDLNDARSNNSAPGSEHSGSPDTNGGVEGRNGDDYDIYTASVGDTQAE